MAQNVSTGHLIDEVATRTGMTKADAKQAVQAIVAVLGERLGNGDRVQISGLGSFEVRERATRSMSPMPFSASRISARSVSAT